VKDLVRDLRKNKGVKKLGLEVMDDGAPDKKQRKRLIKLADKEEMKEEKAAIQKLVNG
jgi:hypothetical protein